MCVLYDDAEVWLIILEGQTNICKVLYPTEMASGGDFRHCLLLQDPSFPGVQDMGATAVASDAGAGPAHL